MFTKVVPTPRAALNAIQIKESGDLSLSIQVHGRMVAYKNGLQSTERSRTHEYSEGNFKTYFETAWEVAPRMGDWLVELSPGYFAHYSQQAFQNQYTKAEA